MELIIKRDILGFYYQEEVHGNEHQVEEEFVVAEEPRLEPTQKSESIARPKVPMTKSGKVDKRYGRKKRR